MIRSAFLLLSGALLASCTDVYVNHKIEFQKTGECPGQSAEVQMESNIAGDRYQFNECLPENFTEKDYTVLRKGDTLVVNFQKPEGSALMGFAVTLDIDAHPRYSHISIGPRTLAIGEVQP